MKIKKMKKEIKKLKCKVFKKKSLQSLNLIKIWSKINHDNSKKNMKILTQNFFRNGKFINNGNY
jgi:hypothetical protein